MRRRYVIVVVAGLLLLAGCGSSATTDLESIQVSDDDEPSVEVDPEFSVRSTQTRVLSQGDGEEIAAGDLVELNYVAVNGRTGKQFDNSYTREQPMPVTLTESSVISGFVESLAGQKVGSRVLAAIAPKDGFGQPQQQLGIEGDDTMIFVFDIVSKLSNAAEGAAQKLPRTVPKLVEKAGRPTRFEPTAQVPETVTEASAHVVIKGGGPPIGDRQNITAHYLGQVYPDGAVFDESWSGGDPRPFSLSGVIDCWKNLLPEQTIGSRVVLICPSDSAFGDNAQAGSPIMKGDTVMFAIDLLAAA